MKTIINDELIMGEPLKVESTLKVEIANQILKMGASDYEDVCNNMRLLADVFEIIEENIDKDIVRIVYNPMGKWQDESRYCSHCHKYMDLKQ